MSAGRYGNALLSREHAFVAAILQLKGDEKAKKMFVGENCGLCNVKEEFSYGRNTLLK